MDHGRYHVGLVVRAHHQAQEQNHQRWHRVERHLLRLGNIPGAVRCCITAGGGQNGMVQPLLNALVFEKHAALDED